MKKEILINNYILYFSLWSRGGEASPVNLRELKKNIARSVKNYNLGFTEIECDNHIALEYENIKTK